MSRSCAAVLVVLLCVGGPLAQAPDDAVGEVERLFREAQRYHLGADNHPRNPRKAVELYWKVVQQDPGHADAYYNLASLCFEQKRYDLARKYYGRTIELLPMDGHARNNLGVVYESQGNLRKAEQLYRKAIQVDPDVAMAHYNLARHLLRQGKTEEALARLERALLLEPENTTFVSQHARIKGEMGKISGTLVGLVAGGFIGVLVAYAIWMHKKGKV